MAKNQELDDQLKRDLGWDGPSEPEPLVSAAAELSDDPDTLTRDVKADVRAIDEGVPAPAGMAKAVVDAEHEAAMAQIEGTAAVVRSQGCQTAQPAASGRSPRAQARARGRSSRFPCC